MRSQLVIVGRLGQLTLVAYLKLLRVVIAERLWASRRPPTAEGGLAVSPHLSPHGLDVAFLVGFALFFAIPFLTYVVRVRLGLSALPPLRSRGAGRRLLSPVLVGYFYWLTKPICRLAIRSGKSASFFTALGLVGPFADGGRDRHGALLLRRRALDQRRARST